MSIKDILVHVDLSPSCNERVRLAMQLAKRFKANLIGAFVLPSSEMLLPPESGAAGTAVLTWLAEVEKEAAERGQQFVATLRNEGIDGAWLAKHGAASPQIARLARMADLVVLGQRDPDYLTTLTTPEDVVLACGRPVLVVPYAGRFDDVGKTRSSPETAAASPRWPLTTSCRCSGRSGKHSCSLSIWSRIRRSCEMAWCATLLTMA